LFPHHRVGIASPVIFLCAGVSAQKYRDLPQSE